MAKWLKYLMIAGGGYLVYKLVSGANELATFIKQLSINIKAGSQPVTIKNLLSWGKQILVLKLNVEFVNPTKTSISFEKPTVTIFYKGNTIAQSKISNSMVTIAPQDVSYIQDLTFEIPIANITIINTLVDICKQLGTGITINESDTLIQKAATVCANIGTNLDAVLPFFDVTCVIYYGGQPFTYKTKIA